jgi:hypothetical protein
MQYNAVLLAVDFSDYCLMRLAVQWNYSCPCRKCLPAVHTGSWKPFLSCHLHLPLYRDTLAKPIAMAVAHCIGSLHWHIVWILCIASPALGPSKPTAMRTACTCLSQAVLAGTAGPCPDHRGLQT